MAQTVKVGPHPLEPLPLLPPPISRSLWGQAEGLVARSAAPAPAAGRPGRDGDPHALVPMNGCDGPSSSHAESEPTICTYMHTMDEQPMDAQPMDLQPMDEQPIDISI